MNKLVVALSGILLAAVVQLGAAGNDWKISYTQALAEAGRSNKPIFALFSGSDWCSPCIKLEKTILDTEEFRKFATLNLVLLQVDFPRRKKMMPIQRQMNEELSKKFGVDSFPTILILSPKGSVLDQLGFEGQTPEEFIEEVKDAMMVVVGPPKVPPLLGKPASAKAEKLYRAIQFPAPEKAVTGYNEQLRRKNYAWLRRILVEQPLKASELNEETAGWVDGMLRFYCWLADRKDLAAHAEKGVVIYEKNNAQSPYFSACLLWMLPDTSRIWRTLNRQVMSGLTKKPAPHPMLAVIYRQRIGRNVYPVMVKAIASGGMDAAPLSTVSYYIEEYGDEEKYPNVIQSLKESKIDPWMAMVLEGIVEWRKAWKERGSGYADTVTDQRWQGFKVHGDKAYEFLVKAWQLHPELPQSAAYLVDVASGRGGLAEAVTWFNRAVAAQIDYRPAYNHMLWALRPRWHGSWHMMVAFGQRAADIDPRLYETIAPLTYIWAVQDIGGEMNLLERRRFLREQFPAVKKILERKIAAAGQYNDQATVRHLTTIIGKHQLLCGDYEGAKKTLALAPGNDNGHNYLPCRTQSYMGSSRQEMDMEIALATGVYAAAFRENDAEIDKGNLTEAAIKYTKLLPGITDPLTRTVVEEKAARLFCPGNQLSFENSKPLFILARYGSIEGVKAFLDAGYDVNARGIDNRTLLQYSLWQRFDLENGNRQEEYAQSKIAMLKFLMSRGADLNALAGPRWTALHLAISCKLPAAVTAFILEQPGVKINAGDIDNETPLIWCAMLDFPEHAKLLLDHGADPNCRTNSGQTALDRAKSDRMRKLLLSKGGKSGAEAGEGK